MKLHKYLLEKKYQLRGENNRTPPYSYKSLCKEISKIKGVKILTFHQHIEENNILDIYNIKLDYFTFNKDINENLDQIQELIDFNDINLSKENLKHKLID